MQRITARAQNPTDNRLASYSDAFERTADTIRARAKRYRNLVVAVTLVFLGSVVVALITWSWLPLMGWLVVVPLCGTFFFLDARELASWQQQIFNEWVQGGLEISTFRQAVRANKALPSGTLEGMLQTLPPETFSPAFGDDKAGVRRVVSLTLIELQSHRAARILVVMVAQTVSALSLTIAATIRSPLPLFGLLCIPLLFGLSQGMTLLRFQRWRREIVLLMQGSRDVSSLRPVIAALDWGGIPGRTKAETLDWLDRQPNPSLD